MEIWKMFLLVGSVVITVTSVITMDGILSDSKVSDAYQKAHLDLKSLAEKYIETLESQVETSISIVLSACKKNVVLKQFQAMETELETFKAALKDLSYDCKSLPPYVEHASAVVTKANATQQVATYTCDKGYPYGGGETTTTGYGVRQP